MKILCIADHIDPTIYSLAIQTRYKDIDLVISAGDLHFHYYDYIMSNLNKPLYFVFGNHKLNDMAYYKKEYKSDFIFSPDEKKDFTQGGGAIYIDQKIIKNRKILIGGLGGSRWYNGDKNQFTEAGMFLKILSLIPSLLFNRIFYGRFIDIFVSHSPPFGINDGKDRCHRGFKVFRIFLKWFRPRYHIHGHVHLYGTGEPRIGKFHETTVINAYDHYILDIQ